MGNACCSTRSIKVLEDDKKKEPRRRSSLILDSLSKLSDYKKKYEYISAIGDGAFGKVRLFRSKEIKEMKYAIKTIKKDYFNQHSLQNLEREVKILRDLDHPNIVKYFETYEDDNHIHIVMEYIPGENLMQLVNYGKKSNRINEKHICEIIIYLLKAIFFLHTNNIIHRDIKPENILFSTNGKLFYFTLGQNSSLKLIDFGLSIHEAITELYRVGSPYFMAPEMIKGEFSAKTDMWSVGVIIFYMITNCYPFKGETSDDVLMKIQKGKYDKNIFKKIKASRNVQDLIEKILVVNPKERISVEETLNHPWIISFIKENKHKVDPEIFDSIKMFSDHNLIQKEIYYFLAKISNEEEIQKLKKAFLNLDKDNNGTIDYDEIKDSIKNFEGTRFETV